MNIQSISLPHCYSTNRVNLNKNTYSFGRAAESDSFSSEDSQETKKTPKKNKSGLTPLQRFMVFVLSGGCVAGGVTGTGLVLKDLSVPDKVWVDYPQDQEELSSIAVEYDVPETLLIQANNWDSEDSDSKKGEFCILPQYNPYEAQVEHLEKLSCCKWLPKEIRVEYRSQIKDLKKKDAELKKVGDFYTDGKNAYIELKKATTVDELASALDVSIDELLENNKFNSTITFEQQGAFASSDEATTDSSKTKLEEGTFVKVSLKNFSDSGKED